MRDKIRQGLTPPVHHLKKSEIVWLATHRCKKHHHSFLSHYACYLREHPEKERIGFLDCECSNLNGDFGILLSYCILDNNTGKILSGVFSEADINNKDEEDKRVVTQLIKDLLKFDRIITWYGRRFDIPFIRTRALICKVPFPYFGSIRHDDIYFISRNRLKLHSNRLENFCRSVLGITHKTHIISKYWRRGQRGDKKALGYILDHNKRDVIDLQRAYFALKDFVARNNTSI